jgi:hypothetical protein
MRSEREWGILFVGDVVGEVGLAYLESRLPALRETYQPTALIVNGENLELLPGGNCGMSPESLARLWALGVDCVTGGNHSWDGDPAVVERVYADARVLRPLNYGTSAPGIGARVVVRGDTRLGVINAVSKTALPYADEPLDMIAAQIDAWSDSVDAVLIDFHGESVTEKLIAAFSLADHAAALVGTHTHVQTADARLIAGRHGGQLAYVTDVGMTGPGGGIQGYAPDNMMRAMQLRLPWGGDAALATGAVEFGAVFIRGRGRSALSIERLA